MICYRVPSNHHRALLLLSVILFLCQGIPRLGADDVCLVNDDVMVCFDDSTLFSLTYLIKPSLSDPGAADTIFFDPVTALWNVTLLDTTPDLDGNLNLSNLLDVSFNDDSVRCDVFDYEYSSNGTKNYTIEWTGVTHDRDPVHVNFNVTAGVTIYSEPIAGEDVDFSITVENYSQKYALLSVDFPSYKVFQLTDEGMDEVLALPWRTHGNLIPDPISTIEEELSAELNQNLDQTTDYHRNMPFANHHLGNAGLHPGLLSAQFFAYYRKDMPFGLYSATTDTLGYLKTFHFRSLIDEINERSTNKIECFTRHFPENNNLPSSPVFTYSMPYQYKMRPFHGDWFDASKIYREWLIHSPITRIGPLRKREEIWSLIDSLDYVMFVSPDTSKTREQLEIFDGFHVGARINAWGFLTPIYQEFPDYMCWGFSHTPRDLVNFIKSRGGFAAPYTNLRNPPWNIFDATLPVCDWDNLSCHYDTNNTLIRSVVLNINHDPLEDNPDPPECKWELCSASPWWQQKYISGIDSTISLLGANALYTDTRGLAELCYSNVRHDHPNGGGCYSIQGRKEIVESIKSKYGNSFPTVNEGPMDIKIGWYDFYGGDAGFMLDKKKDLTRIIDSAEDVPILPLLFHEYQPTIMGLVLLPYADYGVNHFAYGLAYDFVNGHMLMIQQDPIHTTHANPDSEWTEDQWDDYYYVKNLIAKRSDAKDYLVYGELMRPPAAVCAGVETFVEIKHAGNWIDTLDVSPVLMSAYLKVDSLGMEKDSLGLVFTNFSENGSICNVMVVLDEYGLPEGDYQLCEIGPGGTRVNCNSIFNLSDTLNLDVTLEGDSTVIFELAVIGKPSEEWSDRYNGGTNGVDMPVDIAVDDLGGVYVTGYSWMGTGLTAGILTIKYNPATGETLWTARYDGPYDDIAAGMAVNSSGIYVTGVNGGGINGDYVTIKYDPDNGDDLWTADYNGPSGDLDQPVAITLDDFGYLYVTGDVAGGGSSQICTIKYHPDTGDTIWTARYAGPSLVEAKGIAAGNGGVYVIGTRWSEIGLNRDYLTIKYDPLNGDTIWTALYDGTANSTDLPTCITLDEAGDVYVTGGSVGSITTFDDYLTIKYDSETGDTLWTARYDGPDNGSDTPHVIVVNSEGVYVTGESWGDETESDYATTKYNPTNGDLLWVARYNYNLSTMYRDDVAVDLVLDNNGFVYVMGSSEGSDTGSDYATIKYEPMNGNIIWQARYDGNLPSGKDMAYAIALDHSMNVYVTGASEGLHNEDVNYDIVTIKYGE